MGFLLEIPEQHAITKFINVWEFLAARFLICVKPIINIFIRVSFCDMYIVLNG